MNKINYQSSKKPPNILVVFSAQYITAHKLTEDPCKRGCKLILPKFLKYALEKSRGKL